MFSIYSSNIPPKCVKHDPGSCPCCPGVHSIEADARYTGCHVRTLRWLHREAASTEGSSIPSWAWLFRALPRVMILLGASGWVTGEWGTKGAEAWACTPHMIEVKIGSEWRPAYPGSHERCCFLGSAPSVCYTSRDHWLLCLLSLPPFFSGGHIWAILPCIGGTLKSRPTTPPYLSSESCHQTKRHQLPLPSPWLPEGAPLFSTIKCLDHWIHLWHLFTYLFSPALSSCW